MQNNMPALDKQQPDNWISQHDVLSGAESDKLQITTGEELNLEDYQQINQMEWKKPHWVEMMGRPGRKLGGKHGHPDKNCSQLPSQRKSQQEIIGQKGSGVSCDKQIICYSLRPWGPFSEAGRSPSSWSYQPAQSRRKDVKQRAARISVCPERDLRNYLEQPSFSPQHISLVFFPHPWPFLLNPFSGFSFSASLLNVESGILSLATLIP